MKDFILFMYADAVNKALADSGAEWEAYFSNLQASGRFDGGSSIGAGTRFRRGKPDVACEPGFVGFIRVRAERMSDAKTFLSGNPIYEAGGTVEIRELPPDD